jgi:hypothetical protein
VEDNKKEIALGMALVSVVAGVIYLGFQADKPKRAPAPETGMAAPAPTPAADLSLPALEVSDGFIRADAGGVSSNSTFAGWLKQDDLIARFAAAMHILSQGQIPRDSLSGLAPQKKFSVLRKNGKSLMDPRSYARYDGVADGIDSINASAAVAVFKKFKPLIDDVYQGLASKDASVQDALLRGIDELLQVPTPAGDVALTEGKKGLTYVYADAALEKLTPAQKQLLRMGPKNTAKIQFKLREIKAALGAVNP